MSFVRLPWLSLIGVVGLSIAAPSAVTAGEFHDAVSRGDLETIKRLVASNPSLVNANEENDRGLPLNIAAECGNPRIVQYLLEHGADANANGGWYKQRPLYQTENLRVAQLLVEHGADLAAVDNYGHTPLQHAVSRDRVAVVDALLQAGAKLDLDSAVRLGWTDRVAEILRKDPSPAERINKLLFAAAANGRVETAKLLLKQGADPNHDYGFANVLGPYTPFSNAVKSEQFETAKLLCGHGAKMNVSAGRNHENLFLYAIAYLDAKWVKLMVDHHVDLKPVTNAFGGTSDNPLHVVAALGGSDDSLYITRVTQPPPLEREKLQVIEKARLLLQAGADPNGRTNDGATPLLFAAIAGHFDLCKLLIHGGAELDIHTACALGKHREVEAMLRADPKLPKLLLGEHHPLGRTPLHWAARSGNADLVSLLLSHGADPNAIAPKMSFQDAGGFGPDWSFAADDKQKKQRGITPLHVAAERGHASVVQLLLRSQAQIDIRDSDGLTPLMSAVEGNHAEVVELLLQKGANVNAEADDGDSALHLAIRNKAIVETLLDAGANINAGWGKWTPIQNAAVWNDSPEVAELLWRRGAKLDLLTASRLNKPEAARRILDRDPQQLRPKSARWHSDVPILVAAEHGALDVIRVLVDRGASLEFAEDVSESPIRLAAANGHTKVVEYCLQHGVSAGWRGNGDRTLLHEAAGAAQPDVVRFLLDHAAEIAAVDVNGDTALHLLGGDWWLSSKSDDVERRRDREVRVAHMLLEAGQTVQARNGKGETPLHRAAERGQTEIAELLLERGADVNARDWAGRTPLALAEQSRNWFEIRLKIARDGRPVAALLKRRGGTK